MKLNIAAWPRALGSSVSQLLKGSSTSSSADVCLCRGQSHLHDTSNLNQAEIEEFMNELFFFLFSSHFPTGNTWCCYFNHNEEIDSCVKTKTVVKVLTTLGITAWLKCSNTHVENMKKLRLYIGDCMCTARVCSPWSCYAEGLFSGKGWGKRGDAKVLYLWLNMWGKEKIICLNHCLLSCEITGFLDVFREYPFCHVLWNFLDKRSTLEYILFTLLIHSKDLIGFLVSFCLAPVYKGPSIVFSLHPVFCVVFF